MIIIESNFGILFSVMLNYREKYGDDPQPNERGSENIKSVASSIIEKCELGSTIDHLIEYVYACII